MADDIVYYKFAAVLFKCSISLKEGGFWLAVNRGGARVGVAPSMEPDLHLIGFFKS